MKEVKDRAGFDISLVEDVCLGNVSDSKAAYKIRAASLAAGFPNTSGASSVNRFCSSGLKAVQDIANQIREGAIEIGVAGGAELMSAGGDRLEKPFHEDIVRVQDAADCMQPMGQTSENVGKDFNISRQKQDIYAAESYRRAEAAQKAGWFDDEIVPITTVVKDPKTGGEKTVTLTKDEGIRPGTTYESLSKIRPAFPAFGDKSTGGNSSQVTDGAAAVVLMKRSKAAELGVPVLAKFVGATVAGYVYLSFAVDLFHNTYKHTALRPVSWVSARPSPFPNSSLSTTSPPPKLISSRSMKPSRQWPSTALRHSVSTTPR